MTVFKDFLSTIKVPFARLAREEDGAVTVDWVVLTAAIVGIAVTAANTVGDSIGVLAGSIQSDVSSSQIGPGN